MKIRKTSISFELMVLNVGNNDSICFQLLRLSNTLKDRVSFSLPSLLGTFSSDPPSWSQSLPPAHPYLPLRLLRSRLSSGSLIHFAGCAPVTETSPRLVCTPPGPPEYNCMLMMSSLCHSAGWRQALPEDLSTGQLACPCAYVAWETLFRQHVPLTFSDRLCICSQFAPY